MARMAAPDTREPSTGLMIRIEVSAGAAERLAAVLQAVKVASVILAPASGQTLSSAAVAPLVTQGQKAGAAMLLEADAGLARAVRADGVHLPVSDDPTAAYADARGVLGGRFIIGVDAGRSRHDAMSLGKTAPTMSRSGCRPSSRNGRTPLRGNSS